MNIYLDIYNNIFYIFHYYIMKTNSKNTKERSFHVNYKIIFDDDDNIIEVNPSSGHINNIAPMMAVFAIISIMFQLISNIAEH